MSTISLQKYDAATDYAVRVTGNMTRALRIPSNRYVRLACERHLSDLGRKDVWFDDAAARRFFRYCLKLQHYKGPMRGKPLKLELWQMFIFGCIYGWKRIIDGKRTNLWRFNTIYIEVPRKNGKTTIAAAGASYDCGFMESTGAEVYCLATKEDQAKLLHNDVSAYVNASEALQQSFEILKGNNHIYARNSNRTSFIRPLGSDSDKQDGLNPLAAYCDELHAWPKRDLWDVMEEAFGARQNWHMPAITTAGNRRTGICWDQRDHLINILEGRIVADSKFGIIYTVDDDQKENWQDERNWHIANPNLGTGKELEYMRTRALTAAQIPTSLNSFLNKQLDIWTDVAEAWLKVDDWNACFADFGWDDMKGADCVGGIDLARVNDLSAVSYVFPKTSGRLQRVLCDFYMPAVGIKEKSIRDGVDYELWAKQGWIKLTPGKTTDFEFIRKDINQRAGQCIILRFAYDRHFAGELVTNLTSDGFIMSEFGMGFISMGTPTAEVERLTVERLHEHNGNPILGWNAANTVVTKDPTGAMKPDKLLSNKRIDGIVATIMAEGRILNPGEQEDKNPYESRGMRFL